jgi:hypothetical protein
MALTLPPMSDDKLMALPSGDLPGLWSVRSNIMHDRQMTELAAEKAGLSRPFMLLDWQTPHTKKLMEEQRDRERRDYEQRMADIAARQDQLLARIEDEQAAIEKEREQMRADALHLRDGRLAYADGSVYRDQNGTILTGSDEAEAAREHELRPDAPTWKQKTDLDARAAEAQRLHDQVTADRAATDAPAAEKKLSDDEQAFAAQIAKRQDDTSGGLPDYGSADYAEDYGLTSRPAFKDAAASATATLTKTDTETEDIQPPRPSGGNGMKFG